MTSTRTAPLVALALLLACLSPAAHARQLHQTDVSVSAPTTGVQVSAPGGSPAPTDVKVAVAAPAAESPEGEKPLPCKTADGTTVYVDAPYTTVDVSAPGPCPKGAAIVPAPEGTPSAEVSVQAPYTTVKTQSDGSTQTTVNVPGITSINVGSGRKL